jgi:hypothetical protein
MNLEASNTPRAFHRPLRERSGRRNGAAIDPAGDGKSDIEKS